jgi:adenine-specific DNA-methyltransferase
MAKKYTGSLNLDWFNKQKAILVQTEEAGQANGDVPAPKVDWINKDEALFYEIVDDDGRGLSPYWVDRSDLRVKEARPLVFQKAYKTIESAKSGSLIEKEYKIVESDEDDSTIENMLIRGDNLLALNALKKLFENRPDEEKVKCIYIDPPFNTDQAFEHYDDNLEHSLWLTMMRDRLRILHLLLQESGSIFIHLDDNELGYLIPLADEIFGRNNRISVITFKQSSASGPKAQNPGLVTTSNFILYYVKNKTVWESSKVFIPTARDDRYNSFIVNYDEEYSNWRFDTLRNAFAQSMGIDTKSLKVKFGDALEQRLEEFVLENAHKVVQPARVTPKDVNAEARVELEKSLKFPTKVFRAARQGKDDYYFQNGHQILFYSSKVRQIDGMSITGEAATTIWDDLLSNNIHKEGNVSFPDGKKPEGLIKRVLELSTQPGDIVLDCFGGSGTTFAVAQKMKCRWVGIEIGKHADTHIIPRLKGVLTGEDQSGISKAIKWEGGGSFKYYTLGESIIDHATRDFNWKLRREFIEQSLLSSYDFAPDLEFSLLQSELIAASRQPAIGFHHAGQKQMAGVVSLIESNDDKPISYDELMEWYKSLKKFKGTQSVTVFTNRGVEIAYDSKPEDMEVIKVPHAIFAELEK